MNMSLGPLIINFCMFISQKPKLHIMKYQIIVHVGLFFLFDFAPCMVLIRDCMIIYFTIMTSQNSGALDP